MVKKVKTHFVIILFAIIFSFFMQKSLQLFANDSKNDYKYFIVGLDEARHLLETANDLKEVLTFLNESLKFEYFDKIYKLNSLKKR